jgi:uncharacterized membrane protein YkoI
MVLLSLFLAASVGRDPALLMNNGCRAADGDCQQIESFGVQHACAMKAMLKRLTAAGLAMLALSMPAVVRADDDHDHDRARELYEHGEIHALSDILRIVSEHAPGDVVGVDLVRQGDRWVYRFQIVAFDGRRLTLDVDAKAATVMRDGAGD